MTVHVVGAGVAGLAAALALARGGTRVVLWEAARRAGGRCRSWSDPVLDRVVDNGAHVVLGLNRAVRRYLQLADAVGRMMPIVPARFPFLDLASGRHWSVAPGGHGAWVLDAARRPPGFGAADLIAAFRLRLAGPAVRAGALLPRGTSRETFWEPFCTAAFNTPAEETAARPLGRAAFAAFGGQAAAAQPWLARSSLDDAFVAPALETLARAGAEIRLGARIHALDRDGDGVTGMLGEDGRVPFAGDEGVVLAVPPWDAARLLPDLVPELPSSPIVNLHARLPVAFGLRLLGLVGGTAQWVAVRGDVATAVVSAADALIDADVDDLSVRLWADIARALDLPPAPPRAVRVVKERRATLRQTPETESRRPPSATRLANLALAGDWVRGPFPCTLEGAIASGFAAARALRGRESGEVVA